MVNETKKGIDVIAGVNEALKVRKQDQHASEEKIMGHVMRFLNDKKFNGSRVDVIAGVAYAIKILDREPKVKDKEVINRVMENFDSIIQKE
jgi:preprotein translocase subunit SecD